MSFGARVETTLADVFRGAVLIGATSYACSCSGGSQRRDFDDQGLPVIRKDRLIRVLKTALSSANLPAIGAKVTWTPTGGTAQVLKVAELPNRPHEAAWSIRCEEV